MSNSEAKYGSGRYAHQNLDKNYNSAAPDEPKYKKPRSLFNALSEIQRYYVIESRSDDIPKEYFTIEQILDFFKIGLRSGLIEGIIFATLLPMLQTIYPSFKYYFLGTPISKQEEIMLTIISYSSIIISTIFMIYITKYYKGAITKRAIFSLLNGRSVAFLIKGFFIFYLFGLIKYISLKNPNFVYGIVDFTRWIFDIVLHSNLNDEVIFAYYYKYVIPSLADTGALILISMIITAFLPYLTVFYKGFKKATERYRIKEEYENY